MIYVAIFLTLNILTASTVDCAATNLKFPSENFIEMNKSRKEIVTLWRVAS